MPDVQSDRSDSELQKKWNAVLGMVEVQIDNQADFNAYLADTTATSLEDDVLHVTVRNGFVAAWIRQRVMALVRRNAEQVFGQGIKVVLDTIAYTSSDVLVREGLAGDYTQWADVRLRRHRATVARENEQHFPAIPNCTFDRFESSECNARAMNAARSVADNPGTEFNPLTVIAETGQGKTHLLNAIANEMRKAKMNVICLTGEEFVDSFVKSSQNGKVAAVRDRYRDVDALLVDGIERLIGKTGTQTFFLNIVEHLLTNQKQLVFTFNTAYPMHELGEEITSRIAAGLEIPIDPPDRELKRAILRRYATERNLPFRDDGFDSLSQRFARTVRDILGSAVRVNADYTLGHAAQSASIPTITSEFVDESLRDRLTAPAPLLLSPDQVFDAVAEVFNIDASILRRPGRGNQSVSTARDVAIYMLREKSGLTSSQTGNLMGDRQHSTILEALKRYSERRKSDLQLQEAERRIERLLR